MLCKTVREWMTIRDIQSFYKHVNPLVSAFIQTTLTVVTGYQWPESVTISNQDVNGPQKPSWADDNDLDEHSSSCNLG